MLGVQKLLQLILHDAVQVFDEFVIVRLNMLSDREGRGDIVADLRESVDRGQLRAEQQASAFQQLERFYQVLSSARKRLVQLVAVLEHRLNVLFLEREQLFSDLSELRISWNENLQLRLELVQIRRVELRGIFEN